MKIRPVETEFFHADGRTDMTKLNVAFRNFTKAVKNCNPLTFQQCTSISTCHGNNAKKQSKFFVKILTQEQHINR
jgi:hypothetical protein